VAHKNAKQTAKPESFCTPQRKPQPKCPECCSKRPYRDGLRYLANGETVQRWLCRECGYRFSDPKWKKNCNKTDVFQHVQKIHTLNLKTADALTYSCQVGARRQSRAKNLVEVIEPSKSRLAGATEKAETKADIKGKIIEFAWKLKKQGYSESTIRAYVKVLKTLTNKGAHILDPESVKEIIATKLRNPTTQWNYCNFYDAFVRKMKLQWEKPRYKPRERIPFIPMEEELDQLIHGTGWKMSVMLQIAKETAMRVGEITRLRWRDIDPQRKLIVINEPEKGSKPGIYHVSANLIDRILSLPKKSERIFYPTKTLSIITNFTEAKKRLAKKLNNPRLLRITFHTFRHWKATMEYHKTKDILHVKEMLRHRNIKNTLIYITIEKTLFDSDKADEYHAKVAHNAEEALKLVEVGFEYVTGEYNDGGKIFRKRK